MKYLVDFFISLYELLNAMSPYLLLGFLFAGILKVWFPQKWIDRYMGKSNWASVINTALLGIPLPLCSCGVIPTGISFYRNGASKGSSVSFLISTPQTGVDSIMVTYSLLGLPFAIIRVIVALITGVLGGGTTNIVAKEDEVDTSGTTQGCDKDKMGSKAGLWGVFKYGFHDFLMDIAKWLIIGIFIAAALAVVIPDDFFTQYFKNESLSMLAVLVASVPLYLCATASVPIAAILMLKGLSPGAALVLLMAGPATNAATITVIKKVFGNKTLFSYLGSIIIGAIGFGFIINNFLPREWFLLSEASLHHAHHHELFPEWVNVLSTIVLISLLINGYMRAYLKSKNVQKPIVSVQNTSNSILQKPQSGIQAVASNISFGGFQPLSSKVYIVKGMTCSHCKASVEKNLLPLDGISKVVATPSANAVLVEGNSINEEEIKKVVESLGYSFIGRKE